MMLSNKRRAMEFETPEALCKRQRVFSGSARMAGHVPGAENAENAGGANAFSGRLDFSACGAGASASASGALGAGFGAGFGAGLGACAGAGAGNGVSNGVGIGNGVGVGIGLGGGALDGVSLKRKRTGDEEKVGRLETELAGVQRAAREAVAQQELINHNLKAACEEQQKELVRLHQQNKLLKKSVLSLNAKREAAEEVSGRAVSVVDTLVRKVQALEQANFRLCVQQQQAMPSCRQHDSGDGFGGGGGGQVF